MLEDPPLPAFTAGVTLRAGSEADTPAKAGLAGFTARLLTEGTTQRSATTLADDAEQICTSLNAASGVDSTSANLSALINNTQAGLDLHFHIVPHLSLAP